MSSQFTVELPTFFTLVWFSKLAQDVFVQVCDRRWHLLASACRATCYLVVTPRRHGSIHDPFGDLHSRCHSIACQCCRIFSDNLAQESQTFLVSIFLQLSPNTNDHELCLQQGWWWLSDHRVEVLEESHVSQPEHHVLVAKVRLILPPPSLLVNSSSPGCMINRFEHYHNFELSAI